MITLITIISLQLAKQKKANDSFITKKNTRYE